MDTDGSPLHCQPNVPPTGRWRSASSSKRLETFAAGGSQERVVFLALRTAREHDQNRTDQHQPSQPTCDHLCGGHGCVSHGWDARKPPRGRQPCWSTQRSRCVAARLRVNPLPSPRGQAPGREGKAQWRKAKTTGLNKRNGGTEEDREIEVLLMPSPPFLRFSCSICGLRGLSFTPLGKAPEQQPLESPACCPPCRDAAWTANH